MKNVEYLNRLAVENQNASSGAESESEKLNRGTILCCSAYGNCKVVGGFGAVIFMAIIGLACLSGCATAEGRKQIQTDVWRLVEANDEDGLRAYDDSFWHISKWDGKETWKSEEFRKAVQAALTKKIDEYITNGAELERVQQIYNDFAHYGVSDDYSVRKGMSGKEWRDNLESKVEAYRVRALKAREDAEKMRREEQRRQEIAKQSAIEDRRAQWILEKIYGKDKTSHVISFCGLRLGVSRFAYSDSGQSRMGELEKPFRHFREYKIATEENIVWSVDLFMDRNYLNSLSSSDTLEEELKIVATLLEKKFNGHFSDWEYDDVKKRARKKNLGMAILAQDFLHNVYVRSMRKGDCSIRIEKNEDDAHDIRICVSCPVLRENIEKAKMEWNKEQDKKKGTLLDANVGADVL